MALHRLALRQVANLTLQSFKAQSTQLGQTQLPKELNKWWPQKCQWQDTLAINWSCSAESLDNWIMNQNRKSNLGWFDLRDFKSLNYRRWFIIHKSQIINHKRFLIKNVSPRNKSPHYSPSILKILRKIKCSNKISLSRLRLAVTIIFFNSWCNIAKYKKKRARFKIASG